MKPAILAAIAIILVVALRRREPDRAVMRRQRAVWCAGGDHEWTHDSDVDVCFACGALRPCDADIQPSAVERFGDPWPEGHAPLGRRGVLLAVRAGLPVDARAPRGRALVIPA